MTAPEMEKAVEELLARAQYFVDCKYVARANARQKEMGLAYVEAERTDLAREIANFAAGELRRAASPSLSLRATRVLTARTFFEAGQKKAAEYGDHLLLIGWDQPGEEADQIRSLFLAGADALAALPALSYTRQREELDALYREKIAHLIYGWAGELVTRGFATSWHYGELWSAIRDAILALPAQECRAGEREPPGWQAATGATWLIRKNGYFYRPDFKGYTASIYEAGLYSREDAEREAHIEPDITAHPISEYRHLARVDLQNAKRVIALIDAAPTVAGPGEYGMSECRRNFTKDQIIAGLKAGRTFCVDRRDAPELADLQELETQGLAESKLVEIDDQSSVLKFKWREPMIAEQQTRKT